MRIFILCFGYFTARLQFTANNRAILHKFSAAFIHTPRTKSYCHSTGIILFLFSLLDRLLKQPSGLEGILKTLAEVMLIKEHNARGADFWFRVQ